MASFLFFIFYFFAVTALFVVRNGKNICSTCFSAILLHLTLDGSAGSLAVCNFFRTYSAFASHLQRKHHGCDYIYTQLAGPSIDGSFERQ